MNRRSYLSALGASVALGGCAAAPGADAFAAIVPRVEQGETATMDFEAPNTREITFGRLWSAADPDGDGGETLTTRHDDAELSPPRPRVLESNPPQWRWEPARDVSGTVPVAASSDTPPGVYRASVRLARGDSEESQREEVSVEVTADTES